MANELTITRKGNPNFGKKTVDTENKTPSVGTIKAKQPKVGSYRFQLLQTHESLKPRDSKTNEIPDNDIYAPYHIVPNSGVAYRADVGEYQRWRYLFGYNSIWEEDQQTPAPDRNRLNNIDGKNDIIFRNGRLIVPAKDKALYEALMVQDINGSNENRDNAVVAIYELIDFEKESLKQRTDADIAFEAESNARKASVDEMLSIAMVLGIDVQNGADDEEKIRTQFILRAKANPVGFLKIFSNPKNKAQYLGTQALAKGIISVVDNKVVMTDSGVSVFGVNQSQDIADQFATLVMERHEKAVELLETLKTLDL